MTKDQYIIQRKLSLIELADQMKNISKACKTMDMSRQHFYDVKKILETEGISGLKEKTRKKPNYHNRIAPEIEEALLDYSLLYPTHGQTRTSNELLKLGTTLSPSGVRSIWLRHKLENKSLRLKRLEKWAAENKGILTESQIAALEDQEQEKISTGEIETYHPGFLFGQDTYYVGYVKGIGKLYQQTGIDTYSNLGFAKLYLDKTSLCATDFLNDKVLPVFDEHNCRLMRILTDNGKEYCGNESHHYYELYLQLNEIEHTRTKVRQPFTNGATEKLNQTIKEEFYKVAFRKNLYQSVDEIQIDLDKFMDFYNFKRTNQGKRCQGKTPYETFLESLDQIDEYVYSKNIDDEKSNFLAFAEAEAKNIEANNILN